VARASQIRKGSVIKWKDKLWRVTDVQQTFVGKRGAYYQMKLTNLDDGHLELQRFSSDEEIEKAFLESHAMQYLYKEGPTYVFMDPKAGEQINVDEAMLSDILPYLTYNGEVQVFLYEGKAVSVEVPASVTLQVVKTEPAVRGDTATTVNKPAELETGLVIKVPRTSCRASRSRLTRAPASSSDAHSASSAGARRRPPAERAGSAPGEHTRAHGSAPLSRYGQAASNASRTLE